MKVLILGGTTEALDIAAAIGSSGWEAPSSSRPSGVSFGASCTMFSVVFSLAGTTRAPRLPQCTSTRIGGFGGVEGLALYLATQRIAAVIDATHPFATRIGAQAAIACHRQGVSLVRLERPPWQAQEHDRWHTVPDLSGAAAALGPTAQRVFLTTGRKDLTAFRNDTRHFYVIRSIDPPIQEDCPPNHTLVLDRPPFSLSHERDLLHEYAIDVIITKNSGARATEAKLIAARQLQRPVIMVQRPPRPYTETVTTVEAALVWLLEHAPHAGTNRGV